MQNKDGLKDTGLSDDYESDFEITLVTYPCDPKELMIGLDKKINTGTVIYIPPEFCGIELPGIMVVISKKNDLYKVMANNDFKKTIPIGTPILISKVLIKP